MSKPRLLTQNFVQKILAEKQERVFNIKTIIYSKNFYIFLGIFTVCILLFLMFRYFDKREKNESKEKYEIDSKMREIEEYQRDLHKNRRIQQFEQDNEDMYESDDDEKTTTIPHLNKSNNNTDTNKNLINQMNIESHNYGLNSQRVQDTKNIVQEYQENFTNDNEQEPTSPEVDKLNDYLDRTNIQFTDINEIEYP